MMDLLFLLCLLQVLCLTEAQEKTYLITAPKVLRLDAAESVLVQLFGYEQETTVDLYLKDSKNFDGKTYDSQSLKLNAQNKYQAVATLRIFQENQPGNHAYLHAISNSFTVSERIPVTHENGFLFIQTDKPLYTPEQKVEVRVYSFNEELRKSNRPVTLTFKDPDGVTVEITELSNINGVKPLLPPFKIPLKPKLGVWKIQAAYSDIFSTTAVAEFEVKEYVLPSISVHIRPDTHYVSRANFEAFRLKIFARYVNGEPVSSAEVFIRFGYAQDVDVVMIPASSKHYKMYDGELDVVLNIKQALSKMVSGPKDLSEMENHFLRVVILVQESTGGISQGAVLSNIKFVHAPFTLSLIATPLFIKPSLPYSIRVLVRDPLGEPVRGVPVRAQATFTNDLQEIQPLKFLGHLNEITQTSMPDGVAYFVCNVPSNAERVEIDFETADKMHPPDSQAYLKLQAKAYTSTNQRFLYIDLPSDASTFEVGNYANIKIHFQYRDYLPLKTFSYQIISKGKVVKFATLERVSEKIQNINFQMTADMVPSARLVVYYILSGEQRAELVADSVWIDVKAKCVNNLDVKLSSPVTTFKPKDKMQLSVKTKSESEKSLVALSAVDTALYNIRANDKDPLNKVLRHFEHSDLGCGGGGGLNNIDVFSRAGLTLFTNANVKASSAGETCTDAVRPKRFTPPLGVPDSAGTLTMREKRSISNLNHEFEEKAKTYREYKSCCLSGTDSSPALETCSDRTTRLHVPDSKKERPCKSAFFQCCMFAEKRRAESEDKIILFHAKMDFLLDVRTAQVCSY